jgi:hypothetical protein
MKLLFENWRGYLTEERSVVAAVGDSITVGIGSGNKSYIDILGGQKFAIGGKASYNLFGKLKEALSIKPEYLIIFCGINNPMSVKGCRDNWDSELKNDLSKMYMSGVERGAEVIGVSLLPAMRIWRGHHRKCKADPEKYGCCPNLEARNPKKIFQKILDVNDFILSNAPIAIDTSDMWDENGLIDAYDADGIHLNNTGQKVLADKIKSQLRL